MKLTQNSSDDDLCLLCMMGPSDPEREDGFCVECGQIADAYDEEQLNLKES